MNASENPTKLPPSPEPSLQEILPKDQDSLSRDELHDLFMELALRCFNKESQLDMLRELNGNYEKMIESQRRQIEKLTFVETPATKPSKL